jgi:alginate O-acetyltransferase complex protein AlgI
MFGAGGAPLLSPEVSIHFWNNAVFMFIAIIGCTPLFTRIYEKIRLQVGEGKCIDFLDCITKPVINIAILILSVIFMAGQSYNPFLYFKF